MSITYNNFSSNKNKNLRKIIFENSLNKKKQN